MVTMSTLVIASISKNIHWVIVYIGTDFGAFIKSAQYFGYYHGKGKVHSKELNLELALRTPWKVPVCCKRLGRTCFIIIIIIIIIQVKKRQMPVSPAHYTKYATN